MANDLTQDPLYIDTTVADVPCERIAGIVVDASGTGTVVIKDSRTDHILFSTDSSGWYGCNVTIPEIGGIKPAIDVTVSSAAVMVYLGSGKQ